PAVAPAAAAARVVTETGSSTRGHWTAGAPISSRDTHEDGRSRPVANSCPSPFQANAEGRSKPRARIGEALPFWEGTVPSGLNRRIKPLYASRVDRASPADGSAT